MEQIDALTMLMRDGFLRLTDEDQAFRMMTARVSRVLHVQRASIWRLTPARDAIVCRDLHVAGAHSAGVLVFRDTCPAYFRALENSEVIVAHDAVADARTSELADAYLRPLGITSMLDAPVVAEGMVHGVLCLEHVGPLRTWTSAEQSFAIACANLVSLWLAQRARSDSEAALKAERRYNELILRSVREGIHGIDATGRITFENETGCAVLGWRPAEMLGRSAHELVHHHRADGTPYPADDCPILQTLQDGQVRHVDDEVFFRRDGAAVPVEYTCAPIRDDTGAITGVVVSFRDVTERRQLEALRAAESGALRMIAARQPLPDVLDVIARGIESTVPGTLALVMLVDADGLRLRYGSAPSLPAAYTRAMDGLLIGQDQGSCGTAASRRDAVIVRDIATDPHWYRFRHVALAHGLRACWSLPVLDRDGHVIATFALYAKETRTPGAGDLAAMRGAADLLQVALASRSQDEALRASEARFESVARATADVISDWNLVTGHVWWSEDVESTFGYARADLPSGIESWRDHVHPDDVERVAQGLDAAIARGDDYWHAQYRYLHADGRVLYVEDSGCLMTKDDGTPVRFVRGMTNITERTVSQRALKERLKELRCLYRVVDLTTRSAQSVAAICADIASILPESLQYPDVAVSRVVVRGQAHECGAFGEAIATMGGPIIADGEDVGSVEVGYLTLTDVPPGADAFLPEERDLIGAVGTHIGRMIVDRNMLTTLSRSERLRAVGELTGGIAHDFNNLLQVVLGNAELLAEALADDDDLKSLADTTRVAAERGADLTRHLLAFARQQPLDSRPTDVPALLVGMQPLLKRSLGEGLDVELQTGEGSLVALVDPVQFESAVLNLCINARDAMPEGGRVTLKTSIAGTGSVAATDARQASTDGYVLVEVIDNGVGMSADVVTRAFDPFFTTKDVGRGSGLGLSMVYGFIRQSGGHVAIESVPSEGTTVRLYLPRVVGEIVGAVHENTDAAVRGGQECILVVEDNVLVRRQVEGQLQALGYRVVTADSGATALEVLEATPDLDLLFTDVVMPGGMSGKQLADRARALRPDLAVLFTSGYSENEVSESGRLAPGVQLLAKPYTRQQLAAKIRAVLDAVTG